MSLTSERVEELSNNFETSIKKDQRRRILENIIWMLIVIVLNVILNTYFRSKDGNEHIIDINGQIDEHFQSFILDCQKHLDNNEIAIMMKRLSDIESVKFYYMNGVEQDNRLGYVSYKKLDSTENYVPQHVRFHVSLVNNPIKLKAVVYHEYAHALLGYDHMDDETMLMATNISHECYLEQNWDALVKELFHFRPKLKRYEHYDE